MSINNAITEPTEPLNCCWKALLSVKILFELPLGAVHSGSRQRNLKLIPPPVWQALVDEVKTFLGTTTGMTIIDGTISSI